ncbi:MAG: ABC transporter ATP-binding protein, partial [Bacteroidales bacterium]|nr:ABC transporter ATP-binding protein [Bacteroidales bacterium]
GRYSVRNNMMDNRVMDNSDDILTATNVGKTVQTGEGSLHILSAIDFTLKRGESVAIVGVSGSGKSTLLSLLAGLDVPSTGSIRLCGNALEQLDEDGRAQVRGRHVGFVFQSFQLLPNLTALENTLLPMEVLGRTDAEPGARALLARVGLENRLNHYPRQLSGGEQQRVAIARAFIAAPDILFADEPTGNLDAATGQRIIELLFEINRERATTLVLVTHDRQLADRCQRRLELSGGCLV